jgi:hypothetical protein
MVLKTGMRKIIALIILAAFLTNTFVPYAHAQMTLPPAGEQVALSQPFAPQLLKGIKVYANDPFRLDFILDRGDDPSSLQPLSTRGHVAPQGYVSPSTLPSDPALNVKATEGTNRLPSNSEANRLIKYFLAALTVPEKDLWVNLSPYEKDRITPDAFGQTEMGRDLLAQDYILKQITASLLYPEGEVGKEFWAKIYKAVQDQFGTTDIPVDTFNKVWIVPAKATVFENKDAAFVVESKLKVMLESDYVAANQRAERDGGEVPNPVNSATAMSNNAMPTRGHVAPQGYVSPSTLPSDQPLNAKATEGSTPTPLASEFTKQILRDVIIPILEKEVNEGKNFAQLRQVYNSLILATWFKDKILGSQLSLMPTRGHVAPQGYVSPSTLPSELPLNLKATQGSTPTPNALLSFYIDHQKISGIDIADKTEKEKIWTQYVEAFKKGVFNFIKEEHDPGSDEVIPRKYFSGGMGMQFNGNYETTTNREVLPKDFSIDDAEIIKFKGTPIAAGMLSDHAEGKDSASKTEEFVSIRRKIFGMDVDAWLVKNDHRFEPQWKREMSRQLAGDKVLIGLLKDKDNDPGITLIRYCIENDISLGTKSLQTFVREFKKAFLDVGEVGLAKTFPGIMLSVSGYVDLITTLNLQQILDYVGSSVFKDIPESERLTELVLFITQDQKLELETENLKQIYTSLPRELKERVRSIDLPLRTVLQLRESLKKERVRELTDSWQGKEGDDPEAESRLVELVVFIKRTLGLELDSENLGQIYTALPHVLKAKVKMVNLPLNTVLQLRAALEDQRVKDLTDDWQGKESDDPEAESRLVELVVLIKRTLGLELDSENLGQIYIALPQALKAKVKIVNLPLNTVLQLRAALDDQRVKELTDGWQGKESDDPEAEPRLVELVVLIKRNLGLELDSENLGFIYTALPRVLKAKVKIIEFPLNTVLQLRATLDDQRVKALTDRWQGKESDDPEAESRLVELVVLIKRDLGLELDSENLRQIHTALPQALKAKVKVVSLPLNAVLQLRAALDDQRVKALTDRWQGKESDDPEAESRLVELVVLIKRDLGLELDSENLGFIYIALPRVLKAKIKMVDLPLNTVLQLRAALDDQRVKALTDGWQGLDGHLIARKDRLRKLVLFIKKDLRLKLDSNNLRQIYTALPGWLKKQVYVSFEVLDQDVFFVDHAERSFTEDEIKQIKHTFYYLQEIARVVKAEIDRQGFDQQFLLLENWILENGHKTNTELFQQREKIFEIVEILDDMVLKFNFIVAIAREYKKKADGLIGFNEAGEMRVDSGVLYDISDKISKIASFFTLSGSMIDRLKRSGSSLSEEDVVIVKELERVFKDRFIQGYLDMIQDILNPANIKGGKLNIKADFSRESNGLPEEIYTTFLLPALSVIVDAAQTIDVPREEADLLVGMIDRWIEVYKTGDHRSSVDLAWDINEKIVEWGWSSDQALKILGYTFSQYKTDNISVDVPNGATPLSMLFDDRKEGKDDEDLFPQALEAMKEVLEAVRKVVTQDKLPIRLNRQGLTIVDVEKVFGLAPEIFDVKDKAEKNRVQKPDMDQMVDESGRYLVKLTRLFLDTWRSETKKGVHEYQLYKASPKMPEILAEQAGALLSVVYDTEGDDYLLDDVFWHPIPGAAATLLLEGNIVVGVLVSYRKHGEDKISIDALAVDKNSRGTGAVDILLEDFKEHWGKRRVSSTISRVGAPHSGSFLGTVDELKEKLGIRSDVTINDEDKKSETGGIDLTREKMNVQVKSSGEGIQFNFDQQTVAQWQNASGVTPIIIGIQPMTMSLPTFLGLSHNVAPEMAMH